MSDIQRRAIMERCPSCGQWLMQQESLRAENERLNKDREKYFLDNLALRAEVERLQGIEQFATEASRQERDGLRAEVERLQSYIRVLIDKDKTAAEVQRLRALLVRYQVDEETRRALEGK